MNTSRRVATIVALVLLGAACSNEEPAVPVEQVRTIPDVVGASVADAVDAIEDEDLVVTVVPEGGTEDDAVAVESCPKGTVTNQAPEPGDEVRPASTAVLFARGC